MEWFDNVRKNNIYEQLYGVVLENKARLDKMLDEHYELAENAIRKLVSIGISEENAKKLVTDINEKTKQSILDRIEENEKNLERFISTEVAEE